MKKGFTLIELVVVMAIIGILATTGVFAYQPVLKNSRDAKRKSDIKEIQFALENYKQVNGTYPTASQIDHNECGWDVSEMGTFIAPLLDEGFLKVQPKDPNVQSVTWCTTGDFGYFYYRYDGTESASGCGTAHYVLTAHMEVSSNTNVEKLPDCYVQKGTFQSRDYFAVGEFE